MALADKEMAVILKLVADQFNGQLKASGLNVESFMNKVLSWKGALVAVTTTLVAAAKANADFGERLLKNSQISGATVEDLSVLQHAAKLNNVEMDSLTKSLGILGKNMLDAAAGGGEQQQVFKALGFEIRDVDGKIKGTTPALLEMAQIFGNMENSPVRVALAMKALGKGGKEMLPLLDALRDGKKSFAEFEAEARKLGVFMSTAEAQAADDFKDQMDRLTSSMQGLAISVGRDVIPVLNDLATAITELNAGPVGSLIKLFLEPVQIHLIALNTLLKELSANWRFIKGDIDMKQLSQAVADAEQQGKQRLFMLNSPNAPRDMFDPARRKSGTNKAPELPPDLSKMSAVLEADRQKAMAILEDFIAAKRRIIDEERAVVEANVKAQIMTEEQGLLARIALDDREGALTQEKLTKELSVLSRFHQRKLALGFKTKEEQIQYENQHAEAAIQIVTKIMDAQSKGRIREQQEVTELGEFYKKTEMEKGRFIVETEKSYYEITEKLRRAQADSDIASHEASLEIAKNDGRTRLEIIQKEIDLLELRRHKELDNTELTEGEKFKINAHYSTERMKLEEEATGGFTAGWNRAMKQYVQDTSQLGLGQDIARKTAQGMFDSFDQFFFKAMQVKFDSLEDVATSALRFMQQIASQILAGYATQSTMTGLQMLGSFFGGPNAGAKNAAMRGAGNPALFGPGFADGGFTPGGDEVTVGERGPERFRPSVSGTVIPNDQLGGGRPVVINMTIHTPDAGSFRKSAGQIITDMRLAMNRAQRNL